MSKTAQDVKGITTDNERPPVIPMKTDMSNKHLSKKQFVEKYAKIKKADEAAAVARAKVLGESEETEPDTSASDEKIETLRAKLAEVEAKLRKSPEDKKLLKEKNKIAAELDKAEDESS